MRLFSVILGVGVMCAAAPEIARQSVDWATEQRLGAAIARTPGFHAGRVRSHGGASVIEIEDVGVAGAGWSLAAGRIVLPGRGFSAPSLVTPAYARPADAAADNVTLTFGGSKLVIPRIEARGTDLSSQDLATLLDTGDVMTLAERLAKLTAAQITAPTIVLGSPRLPDPLTGDHLTVSGLALTDIGAGRIGALAAAGMTFASPTSVGTQKPTAMTASLEMGKIAVAGIDLPLALEMATGSRTEAAKALQAIVRSFSIDGIMLRPDTGTIIQVGAVAGGALRGRPLTLPPTDVMALVDKPATERTPTDRQVLSDVIADAVESAAFDHLDVRDVSVTVARAEQSSFKLGRAVLDGFDLLRLGTFVIEDAAFSGDGVDVSLGRFVLGGYDGSGLVGVLKHNLADGPDATVAQVVPNRTSLAMTDLHVAIPVAPGGMAPVDPGKRVVVDVPVASVAGGLDAPTGTMTSRAAVEIAYDISAGASDPSYRDLIQYGMSRLDLGAGYVANFDPATKRLSLDRLSFDASNLGQLAMAAVLGNASLDMFQAGQGRDEALNAAQSLVLQSFTVVFVNTGVVEKLLPALAASAKVSVPLFKAQMKAQAEISIDQMLGPTPVAARIVSAVRAFIDTPKSLAVVVKAPSGLSFATAASTADPKTLLDAIDIQVLANR